MKNLSHMIKRCKIKIENEERFGKRKLGSGRHEKLDETDEKFILECIESKSTAHGRRHDQVMYCSRRVKKRDFFRLANYSLQKRGLSQIRSATTVCNTERPKNKNIRQAKNHIGLGLFCTKKPPKSGSLDNELTHYEKAHKKIVNFALFGKTEERKYTLLTSDDDKAYLCPGTSVGFRNTKNEKLFQPSDESKAKQLPKYDFPDSVLNVTPGTHRIMSKEIQNIDGKDEIVTVDKETVCWMRPK